MGFFSAVKKIFGSKEQDNIKKQETFEKNIQEYSTHDKNEQELNQEKQISVGEVVEAPSAQIADASKVDDSSNADFNALALALRSTEAKLSTWLTVTLENVEKADNLFWKRLSHLLKALETPQDEADEFCREFKVWLERMDYHYLNDFRSELQYRLALALDLEDEEDERDRLFMKVQQGLERTRNQLGKGLQSLFADHDKLGESFFEELEELFIMSDMGAELSLKLVGKLREHARLNKIEESSELLPYLQEEIGKLFHIPKRINVIHSPEVVLMVGVNGVGKTTTIAKLAYRAKMQGKKVLIAGADTFRAAAVEQLETWANRIGADFYSKGNGADPAAVAYEAMDKALAGSYDIIFIDTAVRP